MSAAGSGSKNLAMRRLGQESITSCQSGCTSRARLRPLSERLRRMFSRSSGSARASRAADLIVFGSEAGERLILVCSDFLERYIFGEFIREGLLSKLKTPDARLYETEARKPTLNNGSLTIHYTSKQWNRNKNVSNTLILEYYEFDRGVTENRWKSAEARDSSITRRACDCVFGTVAFN